MKKLTGSDSKGYKVTDYINYLQDLEVNQIFCYAIKKLIIYCCKFYLNNKTTETLTRTVECFKYTNIRYYLIAFLKMHYLRMISKIMLHTNFNILKALNIPIFLFDRNFDKHWIAQ